MCHKTKVFHTFNPIFNKDSKILILGTMPSPKSREVGFYYSHPNNRFWKVLSNVLNQELPTTIEDKIDFLINNNIALWDILRSCKIDKASDSSITNPEINDINWLIKQTNITTIFCNGKKAYELYNKNCFNKNCNLEAISLPSTSPANCRSSLEDLTNAYKIILKYI